MNALRPAFVRAACAALPVLLLLATALLALACTGQQSSSAAAASSSAKEAAEMAPEHVGDRPEASEAATTAPATEVVGDPVIYGNVGGHEVTGYVARPKDVTGPLPGLLVIHEWWGLNDNIRAMTRRLAGEGYVALAVDLYGGQVAETPERARELMSAVDPTLALENLSQARDHLAARVQAIGGAPGKIGVIGWCFGGGWSLRSALAMPNGIDATVIYYGHLITDKAELRPLESPVIGFFGADDSSIPPSTVHAFQSALQDLGKSVEIHIYDGAGHAFANPSGTNYRPEAAQNAWKRTVAFLAENLSGSPAGTAGG